MPLRLCFGVAEDQGRRSSMEDRVMAVIDVPGTLGLGPGAPPQAYFGVYDGHNGDECAAMLSRRLHGNLTRADGFADDPAAALVRAFLRTDRTFLRKQVEAERRARAAEEAAAAAGTPPPVEFRFSGATAVAMLVRLENVPAREARDDSTASSSSSSSSGDGSDTSSDTVEEEDEEGDEEEEEGEEEEVAGFDESRDDVGVERRLSLATGLRSGGDAGGGAPSTAATTVTRPVGALPGAVPAASSSSTLSSSHETLPAHGSAAHATTATGAPAAAAAPPPPPSRRRARRAAATASVPRLYIAHAGDCRAVLSHAGRAVDLTVDHKPSTRPDEVARIAAAGGWVHNGRLHGVLAVSRAFGDAEHKVLKERFWETAFTSDPLIVEPDVRVHTVCPRDEFLVLACDGLWDVMTSQMAVNFVRRKLREHGDVQRAAEQLVQKALALSSVDNVSAFVVALGHAGGAE